MLHALTQVPSLWFSLAKLMSLLKKTDFLLHFVLHLNRKPTLILLSKTRFWLGMCLPNPFENQMRLHHDRWNRLYIHSLTTDERRGDRLFHFSSHGLHHNTQCAASAGFRETIIRLCPLFCLREYGNPSLAT
jgi:hypothetical protein